MSLTSRKHLGKQAENVDESGVQLRDADPVSPITNQTWINTSQKKLKTRLPNSTLVLADGGIGASIEIPPSAIVDLAASRAYFKDLGVVDYQIQDIINASDGAISQILINNPNPNNAQIAQVTLPSPMDIEDGEYWLIDSLTGSFYVWFNLDGANLSDPLIGGRTGVPVVVTKGVAEQTDFTSASGADITSGQYFNINSANNAIEYYVWYNKDSLGGDPLVVGRTGVQVNILSSDSAADVASKTAAILNGLPAFNSSSVGNVFTVTNTVIGSTIDASNVSVGGTFSVNVVAQGVAADTPLFLAEQTATALNALPDFNVPNPVSSVITVTNTDSGFVTEPQDGNIGGVFSINITQAGSGSLEVILPSYCILGLGEDSVVQGDSSKLFTIFPTGASLITAVSSYDL